MSHIERHKVYTSQRIAGMCKCGYELITRLNSESFGHTNARKVYQTPEGDMFGCDNPVAVRAWLVDMDMRPEPGETKADHMTYEEKIEAAAQPFSGSGCDGCGKELNTELDFAAHFVIRDRHFLNLGNCPVKA